MCDMRKTIKIFGFGAAVLLILLAAAPAVYGKPLETTEAGGNLLPNDIIILVEDEDLPSANSAICIVESIANTVFSSLGYLLVDLAEHTIINEDSTTTHIEVEAFYSFNVRKTTTNEEEYFEGSGLFIYDCGSSIETLDIDALFINGVESVLLEYTCNTDQDHNSADASLEVTHNNGGEENIYAVTSTLSAELITEDIEKVTIYTLFTENGYDTADYYVEHTEQDLGNDNYLGHVSGTFEAFNVESSSLEAEYLMSFNELSEMTVVYT
jgi:hypothetical protein